MPPNGGLGMNTGIGDAVDLGWKLAAMHHGWGGAHCSTATRRSAGRSASASATRRCGTSSAMAGAGRCRTILDETPEGERGARELGQRLVAGNSHGVGEPAAHPSRLSLRRLADLLPDGPAPAEPEDTRDYRPSSHPGGRAPHAWLADGRSTLDLFGRGFTLLRFADAPDAGALAAAAAARRAAGHRRRR